MIFQLSQKMCMLFQKMYALLKMMLWVVYAIADSAIIGTEDLFWKDFSIWIFKPHSRVETKISLKI